MHIREPTIKQHVLCYTPMNSVIYPNDEPNPFDQKIDYKELVSIAYVVSTKGYNAPMPKADDPGGPELALKKLRAMHNMGITNHYVNVGYILRDSIINYEPTEIHDTYALYHGCHQIIEFRSIILMPRFILIPNQ